MGSLNINLFMILCFCSQFFTNHEINRLDLSKDSSIPEAMFSANINSGCTPLSVQFTNMSVGVIDSFQWSFPGGDPSVSSEENPLVTYENPGTYSVILRVANSAGADELEMVEFIQVFNKPTASFGFLPNMLEVDFQNTSTSFDSVLWDFGDGTNSTEVNPSHLYPSEGTFTVTLITFGCENDTTTLNVNLLLSPTGGFSSDKREGCAPLRVQFFEQSSGTVDSWNWTFEGGVPGNSQMENPSILYDQSGTFDVQLITTNATGSDTTFLEDYITILPRPIGDFEFEVFADSVSFTNLSEFGDSYIWDFGDGDSSTLENPYHIYNEPGVFNVTLTVINDCGANTFLRKVVPEITPEANFIIDGNTSAGCVPFEIQFLDNSNGAISEWEWTFEGGIPLNSNMPDPLVTYVTEGVFPVQLVVSNQFGTDTIFMDSIIVVTNPPIADFDFTIDSNTVNFSNNSDYQVINFWDYGDGSIFNGLEQSHQYDTSGSYLVELVVANSCGLDTIAKEIIIEMATTSQTEVLKFQELDIYPNPNQGSFVLEISGLESKELDLSVLNSLGQKIYHQTVRVENTNLNHNMNLSSMRSGTYFLKISDKEKVVIKRFLKVN